MLLYTRALLILLATSITLTACDSPSEHTSFATGSRFDAADVAHLEEALLADDSEVAALIADPGPYLAARGIDLQNAEVEELEAIIRTYSSDLPIGWPSIRFRDAAEADGIPKWLKKLILEVAEWLLDKL